MRPVLLGRSHRIAAVTLSPQGFAPVYDALDLPISAGLAVAGLLAFAFLLRAELGRRARAERARRASERQFAGVTSALREAVVVYGPELRLEFVNPAFEALTGWSIEELRERNFIDYVHPDDRARVTAAREALGRGEASPALEYRIITRSGENRWVDGQWRRIDGAGGAVVAYVCTELDVTARRSAEASFRAETEIFQALTEAQDAVAAAGPDAAVVMRTVAERAREATGASGAIVELARGTESVPAAAVGLAAPTLPMAGSLSGECVRTGEPQRCDDTSADPRVDRAAAVRHGVRSILVVPLRDDRRVIGVLKVVAPVPRAFAPSHERLLRLLGGLLGGAVAHASAYAAREGRLEERTRSLQESEQRFKQLVDAAQEGVWVVDDRGVTTYVNRRMTDLLGYAHSDVMTRPIWEFMDSASRTELQRALTAGEAVPVRDVRFRRGDGTDLWTIVSISPILGRDNARVGTVAMVTDITERKGVEDRLRRSAERLRLVHELDRAVLAARSPDEIAHAALVRLRRLVPCVRCSIVTYDHARGEARVLAGWRRGEALQPATLPLERFSSAETLRRGVLRYIEDVADMEARPPVLDEIAADGVRALLSVPLLVEGAAIGELNIGAGAPRAYGPEDRDIAVELATPLAIAIQQARLREELARQTVTLERRVAERTAELEAATSELEAFTNAVSEDFRAPIRHIGGFADVMLDEYGPRLDAPGRHYLERIRGGAKSLATLVEDLLRLARVGAQDPLRSPTSLDAVVEEARAELAAETDGRSIEWQVEALPMVDGDPALLRLAIRNLLSNAVKFTGPRDQATIRVFAVQADGQAGLAVADNGVGFGMSHADRLFGVFERLHHREDFEGNGVGLAIVRQIARKHGGRVWAESEPDRGATFYLTLGEPPPAPR